MENKWSYEPAEIEEDDIITSADILKDGKSIFTLDLSDFNGISTETAAEIVDKLNSVERLQAGYQEALNNHISQKRIHEEIINDKRFKIQDLQSESQRYRTALEMISKYNTDYPCPSITRIAKEALKPTLLPREGK